MTSSVVIKTRAEYMRKKSLCSALEIFNNTWVSREGLLKIRCTVRGVTLICSASHSFVCPCRRSSSLIRLPMCICIVVALCASCYRFLDAFRQPQTKKEASNFVSTLRSSKIPSGIDKMLACLRAFAHLSFLNDL